MTTDLHHALRTLLRAPVFTAVATLSLALAVGANAVIFGLVDALLLRPLPVPEASRLVRIGATAGGETFQPFSWPEVEDYRGTSGFDGIAGHQPNSIIVSDADGPRTEWMEIVTANFFDVLRVRPQLGRAFVPEEDLTPGGAPVLVISDALWRGRFGADPAIVGRVVRVNGHPFTVVGVAPAGFHGAFPGFRIDVWVPAVMLEQALPSSGSLDVRSDRFLMLLGRIGPGVTRERALAGLELVARRMRAAYPEEGPERGVSIADATGVHPFIATLVRAFLALLMGIVGLVLLIACANVANLMLARGDARRREIGIRLALGAGRGRIARELLTESLMIAVAGGVVGTGFAFWGSRLLTAFRPSVGVPVGLDLSMDVRVLAFTFAIAALAGIGFGLAPALAASKADVVGALRTTAGIDARGRRRWVRGGLVVSQVAVSAVLLVGAGLLARSLLNSRTIDPGFDASHVVVMYASPELLQYDEASARQLWRDVEERARSLPGVRRVSLALWTALGDRSDAMQMAPEGSAGTLATAPLHPYNLVTPGYFATLGIPLLGGRDFGAQDAAGGTDVAVINQAMERRFWPDGDALGQRIAIRDRGGNHRTVEVIGVTATTKIRTLGESPRPIAYLPYAQWYRPDMVLHVLAAGDPHSLIGPVQAALHAIEPDLPAEVSAMEDEMAFSLIPARLASWVLGFAGGIGLLLAAIGVFGVVSQSVGRRLREMGIRMALGARRTDVRRLVLVYGLKLVAIGLAIGLMLAVAGAQLLRSLLNGVGPVDPVTYVGIALMLCAVAVAACWVPARRATAVDPAVVLRSE